MLFRCILKDEFDANKGINTRNKLHPIFMQVNVSQLMQVPEFFVLSIKMCIAAHLSIEGAPPQQVEVLVSFVRCYKKILHQNRLFWGSGIGYF